MNIAVLASGRGSNFKAIAEAVKGGVLAKTRIVGLISNKSDAPALETARQFGIPPYASDAKKGRKDYEVWLLSTLNNLSPRPDYLVLAGYMLLLPPEILRAFPNRVLNIHPSLLPSFVGLRPQQQALDHGVLWTGCTVHLVNEELDAGPILMQAVVPIEPGDTEETLGNRLLPIEHKTYVETLRRIEGGGFTLVGRRVVWAGQG